MEDTNVTKANVDINLKNSIEISIVDALVEGDIVKFTIKTKTNMPQFKEKEIVVSREHNEFVWLHERITSLDEYSGIVIPPCPIQPDFTVSEEKLQKLNEGESSLAPDELAKLKQELESEYLALFKKTVANHENFLIRIAKHPVLHDDINFRIMLEHKEPLNIRERNTVELIKGMAISAYRNFDEKLILSLLAKKDDDEFFENQKVYIMTYLNKLKDSVNHCDSIRESSRLILSGLIRFQSSIGLASGTEISILSKVFNAVSESLDKYRKLEAKSIHDFDLKLTDSLKYVVAETESCKFVIYKRLKLILDLENSNKAIEKSQSKPQSEKDTIVANRNKIKEKLEKSSTVAKSDLHDIANTRMENIKTNILSLFELQCKHAKNQMKVIKEVLEQINACN